MRLAIYARVSTSHHNQTPDNQLIPLREYTKARGFEHYKEYVDITSGTKEKRPALDELLADAKKRKFDAVLVWKLDRLGRSLKHLITLIDEFQALSVQFISYTEGMDTTTPAGKLLFSVVGAIAAFERDLIRERVKAGLHRARSQGKRLGRPASIINLQSLEYLKNSKKNYTKMSKETGISRTTLWRRLQLFA